MRKRDKAKSAEEFWAEISELNEKEQYDEVTKNLLDFIKNTHSQV